MPNILDLPLEQKFMIASMCLSVESLTQIVLEQGGTHEVIMKRNSEYIKKHLEPGISETKINLFLEKVLVSFYDSLSN